MLNCDIKDIAFSNIICNDIEKLKDDLKALSYKTDSINCENLKKIYQTVCD